MRRTACSRPKPDQTLLDLRTFSRVAVTEWPPSSSTVALNPGKPLALLVYLACSPQRAASREELTDLLWADLGADDAKHSLRQAAWYIRKRLGDDTLSADAATLRLACEITFDRDRFLAAVEAGELTKALQEYTGDFLGHLALPGGAHFEEWADLERRRLRSMFIRCAEATARTALATGRYKDAQALARRVLDGDAFNFGASRLLLESLVAAGDVLGAATEADRLEQFLEREGVEPDPATRTALRQARNTQGASSDRDSADTDRPAGLITDLIGRHREFEALLAAWESARRGHAVHVQVVAPAGFGKTRLLRDLRVRLRSMRARTALVRVNPGEQRMPYSAAADVAAVLSALPGARGLDSASAAALVALNPALSSTYPVQPDASTGEEAARRRTIALGELARAVADESPLALLIDDVHWLDEASAQLLHAAATRWTESRVWLVTTSRPVGASRFATPDTHLLALEPLTSHQVQEFVSSIATLPDQPWTDSLGSAIHSATLGSPLLLIETLQLALERGTLQLVDGSWRCADERQLAELLRSGSALERRLGTLSREQTWVLTLLAVAGVPLPAESVSAASGGTSSAGDDLSSLERRGLVRDSAGLWLVAHDEISDALLRICSQDAAAAAHRSLGRELASHAQDSPTTLRMSVQHLRAARDTEALRDLFHSFVTIERHAGDKSPTRRLAERFLGGKPSSEECVAISAGLPLRLRLRASRGAFAAAALLLLAVVATAAAFWTREPFAGFVLATGQDGLQAAGITPALLREGGSLSLHSSLPTSLRPIAGRLDVDEPFVALPRGRWAFTMVTPRPDTGGIDIYMLDAAGQVRRLTSERSDDLVLSASPDGQSLLIGSGRWSSVSSLKDVTRFL